MSNKNDDITYQELPYTNYVTLVGFLETKPIVRIVDDQKKVVVKLALAEPSASTAITAKAKVFYVPVVMYDDVARKLSGIAHLHDLLLIRGYFKCRPFAKKDGTTGVEYFIVAYNFDKVGRANAKQVRFLESREQRINLYVTDYETFIMEKEQDGTDVIYMRDDVDLPM